MGTERGERRTGRSIWRMPVPVVVLSSLLLVTCGEEVELRGTAPGADGPRPAGDTDGATGRIATFVVASEPDVTIGVESGEAPYNLSGVTDATVLSDGTIVVANCQSGELRYFDPGGRFLRSTGRQGRGPGEFTFLRRIFPLDADTLGLSDPLQARITTIAPDGGVARTIPLGPVSAQFLDVLGRFSDGSFVARRLDPRTSAEAGSRYRATATLLRLDGVSGEPVDSVADLPASDMLAPATPRGPFLNLRLRREAVFAVSDGSVFYGGQDERGIIEFNSDLDSINTLHTITRSGPVTEEVKQAFQEMMNEGTDIPQGGVGPANAAEYASMLPAFRDIVAGKDGRLWVQDPVRPGVYPLIWTAYDDGEAVARVELPPRFFPFEFSADQVLGVSFDDLNVERVELRSLFPGKSQGRLLSPRDAEPPAMSRCGAWASR